MTTSDRWYSSPTQVFWTCKALLEGRTLTTKTEIREVKGWRLAAIAGRLKNEYGWPINSERRGPENIGHYWLTPGTDVSRLRFPASAKSLADTLNGGAK